MCLNFLNCCCIFKVFRLLPLLGHFTKDYLVLLPQFLLHVWYLYWCNLGIFPVLLPFNNFFTFFFSDNGNGFRLRFYFCSWLAVCLTISLQLFLYFRSCYSSFLHRVCLSYVVESPYSVYFFVCFALQRWYLRSVIQLFFIY